MIRQTKLQARNNRHNLSGKLVAARLLVLALALTATLTAACSSMPSIPGLTGGSLPSASQPATAQPATRPATTGAFAPTLTVDPPGGYGGMYVRVSGSGWPRNMLVVIALADAQGKSNTLASVNTDSEGTLSTGFLYPIGERWLADNNYQVIATTANGNYEVAATFTVGEPGTAVAAAPDRESEAAVEEEPVAEAAVAEAAAAIDTEAETPADARADEDQEIAADKGENSIDENIAVSAAVSDGVGDPMSAQISAGILAGFIPLETKKNKGVFIIQAQADSPLADGYQLVAWIQTPPLENYRDIKLDWDDDDWEVKFTGNKVEIEAPNPEELVSFMQIYGGFPVSDGQRVEVKIRPSANMKIEYDDGKLEVEGPTVTLHVAVIGPNGPVGVATATLDAELRPPGLSRSPAAEVARPPAWFGRDRDDD